jgi:hypothetical protein
MEHKLLIPRRNVSEAFVDNLNIVKATLVRSREWATMDAQVQKARAARTNLSVLNRREGRYGSAVDDPLPGAWSASRADLAAAMLAAQDPALIGHVVTIAA